MFLFRVPSVAFPGAQKKKVFVDQDARGPADTNMRSILVLLQSPEVEVLGISITSGDGWARAGTQTTLRMLELTGHAGIPVATGAEHPLLNSPEETASWEARFGEFAYKGAWNPQGYHPPDVVPTLPAGNPTGKPLAQHGALFLIETLRKHPGEVTLWVGGPLTTVALAIRLDPEVTRLAKELVMMAGGFNVEESGIQELNGRREFNFWWDPEAARMVMSSPWKKITITPLDVAVKAPPTGAVWAEIAQGDSATARYLTRFAPSRTSGTYMWDEVAAVALVDPGIITRQQELYVNVDIDHGAGYGQTIFLQKTAKPPAWLWKPATVQFDLDTKKFYRTFINLMKKPSEGRR